MENKINTNSSYDDANIEVIPTCSESDFKDSGLSRQGGIPRMTTVEN